METKHFRLTKALIAVKFGETQQTKLLRLPLGADVDVFGSSVIWGCVEIVCDDQHYHIFEEDLLCHSTTRSCAVAGQEHMSADGTCEPDGSLNPARLNMYQT